MPGNFDDDLALVAGCDWVIEAVTENLEIKQALLEKIAPHLKPDAILTTNTSGLPIASIAAKMPRPLRRRWLGTHFFNPPRYMRLVEIVATPETDAAVVEAIAAFADRRLGKEVVFARDTPNFIANRIGIFAILEAIRLMQEEDLTVEEVDALTGPIIGWPRTGTFRLVDLVGLDVVAHIVRNFPRLRTGEETVLPPFLETMLERRWLGDKTKQGFYRKETDREGREIRFALDWKTLEYRQASTPKFSSLETARKVEALPERIALLLHGDTGTDKAARFHWRLLTALWNYAADCLPEIADNVSSIDRAMRAGFNWEMGPFELADAAGVRETVRRMKAAGEAVSPVVERLLAADGDAWYRDDGRECFDPVSGAYKAVPVREGVARVAAFRKSNGVVRQNAGASLVDLGDGVACLELRSKKAAIGEDVIRLVTDVLRPDGDAVRNFSAFVVSGDAGDFSSGADLTQVLLSAQAGAWETIDRAVGDFQRMTASIKYCLRPVVAAPFGSCLGGGAEMAMHGARRQVHAELYMGLAEGGVGLVPSGGGCKEMTLYALGVAASSCDNPGNEFATPFEALRRNFETIALGKVSTSAFEARRLGFLPDGDRITMNRERLLSDAKELVLRIAGSGYTPPAPRTDIPAPGAEALDKLRLCARTLRQGGTIADHNAGDHDVKVADWIAYVLCGGGVAPGTLVSEQYLLDLEREAFLSLCGEKKTQERIAYTLKTGKALRN